MFRYTTGSVSQSIGAKRPSARRGTVSRSRKNDEDAREPERGQKDPRTDEQVVSHSVNHPIRLDALNIFYEREASPNEIQKELRKPLATVSHHVKELHDDGVIELVKTEPRRGAVEHFYRAKRNPEVTAEEWKGLPRGARRGIANVAMHAIVADGLASMRHKRFEVDDDMYIAWMPMRLSEQGEGEVTELQAEILERLNEIATRDEARQSEDGEKPRSVRIAATLWFERAQPGRPPAGRA
jgi:DNA-binding transcriptional ArsR family regulator